MAAAARAWILDPQWAILIAAAALYGTGSTRTVVPARSAGSRRLRGGCFYAALALLAVALSQPVDSLSEKLFWVHMVQHVLLLMVVAPLIVLARPWMRLWRALPLSWRRGLGRGVSHGPRAAPLRALSRALGHPVVAFVVFSANLLSWHVPALFDATLRSGAVHALEHILFLSTAILFFKQVIDSPPLRAPLAPAQRALYAVGGMIVGWILAVGLAIAPHPLYGHYAHLTTRPGGLSALGDQQIAAGIMWVPGSVTFVIVILSYVHRWLMPPAQSASSRRRLAGEH